MPDKQLLLGFFDPSITLGHLLTALITGGAAVWVGKKISRRNLDERSVRDLLVRCCGEAMVAITALADAVEVAAAVREREHLDSSARSTLFRKFQIYSNHVAIISMALKQACTRQSSLKPVLASTGPLKNAADELQDRISEPLVRAESLSTTDVRAIHGSVYKNRELLLQLQLNILYPPEA